MKKLSKCWAFSFFHFGEKNKEIGKKRCEFWKKQKMLELTLRRTAC